MTNLQLIQQLRDLGDWLRERAYASDNDIRAQERLKQEQVVREAVKRLEALSA